LERDSSGEKADEEGSESILIAERSSAYTFPKRIKRAWVKSNKPKVKRKIGCEGFSIESILFIKYQLHTKYQSINFLRQRNFSYSDFESRNQDCFS
jgi:hypothetical protein